ncbi:MAG TPA: response regulator [Pyrinomonadaceae bacterium]|jgi:signal transduction histidine kinase|nr:response regulator [Pyrinomonadaceae bacterium]
MKLEDEIAKHRKQGAKNCIGKILLIEDDVELMNVLVDVLTEQHYEVTGLTSAIEGLECLHHESYDILLSDLMMPEMDGLELLHAALQVDRNLVCILMTGQGTIQSAVEAMKIGAFDYLLKPFRLNCVNPVLNRALHARRQRLEKVRRELDEQRMRLQTEEQLRQSQKMEAIGQLAGGVAHDFNNLLTAINGYSELALRRISSEDPLTKNLEEIKKAGNRAASLTRQLLAFSRKQAVEPRVLDLNSIVADVEKMLRRIIGENIELRTELAASLGSVRVDAGQLEQVLMNLAVNARDAMPDGGKLLIKTANVNLENTNAETVANSGPHVMLAVSDNGIGMSQETQAHIFEPFFTTKGKGRGTGLGLSMVYGIVQQFNGSLSVESEEQKGSRFKVYLPQVNPDENDTCKQEPPAQEIEGSETVLVVEDEDIVRHLAKQILKLHGYSVLDAANGGAALRICEQHTGPIQLLLSDVIMPEMGGVELSRRLSSIRPDIKVLFMSGYTEEIGPTNFIHKPFSHHDLVSKVREVLDASV